MLAADPRQVVGRQRPIARRVALHLDVLLVAAGDRALEAEGVHAQPPAIVAAIAEELREELGHVAIEHRRKRAEQPQQLPGEYVVVRRGCAEYQPLLGDALQRRQHVLAAGAHMREPGQVVVAHRRVAQLLTRHAQHVG